MDLRIADVIEARAWRDLLAAAPSALGCLAGDVPGTVATVLRTSAVPAAVMNRVIGLEHDGELPDATVEWMRQVFHHAAVEKFWVTAWDHPAYAGLTGRLASFRPEPQSAWFKFLLNLDNTVLPLPKEGSLSVRLARPDEASLAGDIVCRGMGMPQDLAPWFAAIVGRPQWQLYFVCNEQDQPVAAGSLYVDGLRAWLGVGATLPEARRQGAQQMLLAMRLLAAKAAGCAVAAVEAEVAPGGELSPSARNIVRAGFQQIGIRINFLCASN